MDQSCTPSSSRTFPAPHAGFSRCLAFALAFAPTPSLSSGSQSDARLPEPVIVEKVSPEDFRGIVAPRSGRVQVWVDLAMPAVAQVPMPSSRNAYRHAVAAQQAVLSSALRELGAVELARVRMVRNSIAVELPAEAVDAVRRLPGVLRVRPVTHLNRIHALPPSR